MGKLGAIMVGHKHAHTGCAKGQGPRARAGQLSIGTTVKAEAVG